MTKLLICGAIFPHNATVAIVLESCLFDKEKLHRVVDTIIRRNHSLGIDHLHTDSFELHLKSACMDFIEYTFIIENMNFSFLFFD